MGFFFLKADPAVALLKLTGDDKLMSVLSGHSPKDYVSLDYARSKVMFFLNLSQVGTGNLCHVLVLISLAEC